MLESGLTIFPLYVCRVFLDWSIRIAIHQLDWSIRIAIHFDGLDCYNHFKF